MCMVGSVGTPQYLLALLYFLAPQLRKFAADYQFFHELDAKVTVNLEGIFSLIFSSLQELSAKRECGYGPVSYL
jgi:hypothetical protein